MPKYIVQSYLNCERCPLHAFRRNVIFGRGDVPCDILMVGEAPGKAEDLLGIPFVGPSGRILNAAIDKARILAGLAVAPRIFITNICACRPTDEFQGANREPTGEEAWACWERLERTYADCRPRRVALLGAVAKKYGHKAWPEAHVFVHPAYILRAGGTDTPIFRAFCQNLSALFLEVKCTTP